MTRADHFMLYQGRFRLDIREYFFPKRVVRHWHRLPREVVRPPFLEMVKNCRDVTMKDMSWPWWECVGVELDLRGIFRP